MTVEEAGKAGMEPGLLETRSVMGLRFLDCSLADAAELIARAARRAQKLNVFFVNAHCINVAAKDGQYDSLLRDAGLLFADGVGMALAARLLGTALDNNVNGTDLFPYLCSIAAEENTAIAFLGAEPGVAEQCAARMREQYPGLRVVHVSHGYLSSEEEREAISHINNSGAGMLFVARGVPTQEHWIAHHREEIKVPVMLGVGALFDFYSGRISRAPKWMRNLRLEWLYRLMLEPRRMFCRYIVGNPAFIFRVIRRRMGKNDVQ